MRPIQSAATAVIWKKHLVPRVAIGQPPPDHVADAQIDQDQPDQHSPDVEAGTEVGGHQPGGAELHRKRRHTGEEDEGKQEPAGEHTGRKAI